MKAEGVVSVLGYQKADGILTPTLSLLTSNGLVLPQLVCSKWYWHTVQLHVLNPHEGASTAQVLVT